MPSGTPCLAAASAIWRSHKYALPFGSPTAAGGLDVKAAAARSMTRPIVLTMALIAEIAPSGVLLLPGTRRPALRLRAPRLPATRHLLIALAVRGGRMRGIGTGQTHIHAVNQIAHRAQRRRQGIPLALDQVGGLAAAHLEVELQRLILH